MEYKWPYYEVADDQAVYALGVVSINFARFERTNIWMLAALANMKEEHAALFTSRTNPADRASVLDTFFKRRAWPKDVAVAIDRYIRGMRVLNVNRNTLVHGNLVRGPNNTSGIFSLNRNSGEYKMLQASLEQIRQVADDLQSYFEFGLALSNYIAADIHHMAREPGMLVVSTLPHIPDEPAPINARAEEATKRKQSDSRKSRQ
jgi:hypothetical protein